MSFISYTYFYFLLNIKQLRSAVFYFFDAMKHE